MVDKLKYKYLYQKRDVYNYKINKVIDNHICSVAKYRDYKNIIYGEISKLKELWKNEYKNSKIDLCKL